MATRVRKLAKELRRDPSEILGLLHELGYVRYRSTEDQISDVAVDRIRDAVRQGLKAAPVQPTAEPRAADTETRSTASEWMAKIIPGVVRRQVDEKELGPGEKPAPRAKAPKPEPPPERATATDAGSDVRVEAERATLEVERAKLETAKNDLFAARAQLERARVELAEARSQVEQIRYELEQERIELQEARVAPASGAVSISELLEARGIRGSDEQQRALAALASGRHLGAILPDLRLADAGRVRRILDDRIVLVAGEAPASLQGVAAITVAPERAELPDAREIERLLTEIGEQLLLNGLRRLVIVNAAPRWQRLIREGLDRRVEAAFRPVPGPDSDPALSRVDAVVLWRLELPEQQRNTWAQAAGRLIAIPEPALGTFLVRLRDRLRDR